MLICSHWLLLARLTPHVAILLSKLCVNLQTQRTRYSAAQIACNTLACLQEKLPTSAALAKMATEGHCIVMLHRTIRVAPKCNPPAQPVIEWSYDHMIIWSCDHIIAWSHDHEGRTISIIRWLRIKWYLINRWFNDRMIIWSYDLFYERADNADYKRSSWSHSKSACFAHSLTGTLCLVRLVLNIWNNVRVKIEDFWNSLTTKFKLFDVLGK